jgi:hypothetical protein
MTIMTKILELLPYLIPTLLFFGVLHLGHWEARSTFYSLADKIANENRRQIQDAEDKLIALIISHQVHDKRKNAKK